MFDANGDGCPADTATEAARIVEESDIVPAGVKRSLKAKLEAARRSYAGGNVTAAENQLSAAVKEIDAQTGKGVPQGIALLLKQEIGNIKATKNQFDHLL